MSTEPTPAPQPSGSPTPRTTGMFQTYVSDEKDDGTYTLKLDAEETRDLFYRIGVIETEFLAARAALLASQSMGEKLRDALEYYNGAPWVGHSGSWANSNLAQVATAALSLTPASCSADLAELQECKADLDWLDEHKASILVNDEEPLTCLVQASDDYRAHGVSNPYNIRAAIRAARKAT